MPRTKKAISVFLIIVGFIHLLPLSGVFGAEHLARLYGLTFDNPDLLIMMRHRAVLFGLLGSALIYAAFKPAAWMHAIVAGFASVISFLALALSTPDSGAAIHRVVIADIVALVCLTIAATLMWWPPAKE